MKRIVMLTALALLNGCASAPDGARQATRVLSYNIHAGKDAQLVPNVPRVAAFIDSLKPDVVLLQEIDRRTRRASGEDHLAQLEQLTGMRGVFGKSLDYDGGEYGIAILTRWPVDTAVTIGLKTEPPPDRAGGSKEPRVALYARVRTPSGPLHVVNTHIDAGGPATFRRQEVIGILAAIKRMVPADEPLLLGGDLNARPHTDEITAVSLVLTDAWQVCGSGPGYTFNAAAPDRRIDYVFYRQARCLSARVPETQASDHRPLFVTIELSRRP